MRCSKVRRNSAKTVGERTWFSSESCSILLEIFLPECTAFQHAWSSCTSFSLITWSDAGNDELWWEVVLVHFLFKLPEKAKLHGTLNKSNVKTLQVSGSMTFAYHHALFVLNKLVTHKAAVIHDRNPCFFMRFQTTDLELKHMLSKMFSMSTCTFVYYFMSDRITSMMAHIDGINIRRYKCINDNNSLVIIRR